MERKFRNAAALRHQVLSSSPELKSLESKLRACALTHHHKAAIAEKEAHMKLMNVGEREYADLVKQLDHEENLSASLILADKEIKKHENQRVLEEQIAEKASTKAKNAAENVIAMMAEVDESKLMEKEKKERWMERQAFQENTRLFLQKQTQLRELLHEEGRLQDRNLRRSAEEYNLKVELQKELERQNAEIQRLQRHQQEVALIHRLEEQQMEKDQILETRQELEILEKSAQEKKFAEEKEKSKEEARLSLIRGLDDQMIFKKQQEAREKEKDDEYMKLLLEVMAEEGNLEQLVATARRRRQLDHRRLVESLLEERRAMRARLMRQQHRQDQDECEYNLLRKSILEEEEKQLLLKHVPHLMPYFTPELHARLRQLL